MLWTTPESLHEKLPLTNKSGDLTITADARIDNRDELISTLNYNGRPRETITDSEIILAAYEKWGEKCPEKLLGDFSFVIWDNRKKIIYCARDPIGIKPFYYYFKEGKFRWSSEPKAIFEDTTIPKEPNLQLMCLYLLNRFDEREETLYKDVYRLPPSHFMVLENERIRKGQYWDIDPNYSIRYKTDEEYAEHFLSLFKEAVRVRLRSHGPVGALLSGGLDSSSVVCTAQMLYEEKSISNNGFETFSIIFDKFPCNERLYIDEVVRKWNVNANYFIYGDHLSEVDFEQINKYLDIYYSPTLLCFTPALKDAREKGIKVMLNGIGGDDLLAVDVDHLTDILFQGNIRKLIKQLQDDSVLYSCSPCSLFLNYCIKPLIPLPMKLILKQILKPFRMNGIPSWINIEYLRKTRVDERLKTVVRSIEFPTRSQQRIYQVLRYGWNNNIAFDILERFIIHFGIENRYPFFDRRLVELCLALPEEQRWRGKWPKTVLRQSMEGILPELIKDRKDKAEFTSIVDLEFKDRQNNKIDEFIKMSALADFGLINIDRFSQLFKYYQNGKISYRFRNTLEIFVWLELWCRSVLGEPKGGNKKWQSIETVK
jgi:asparagine synthase (glutamine-hydrolysing)